MKINILEFSYVIFLPERDSSSVGITVMDARSQLFSNKVEPVELLKWGLYKGLI